MAQAVRTKASVCAEKQRLADAFVAAVQEVMKLQDAEFANLASGGSGLVRLDLALTLAHKEWVGAKWAYDLHLQHHGC